jgi:hypothetical protein
MLAFGLIDPRDVRVALVALFALMIEVGATFGLFAALSHSAQPSVAMERWRPSLR